MFQKQGIRVMKLIANISFLCSLVAFILPNHAQAINEIAEMLDPDETFAVAWNPVFTDYVAVGNICQTPHNKIYKKEKHGSTTSMRLVFTAAEQDNTFALAWDPSGTYLFVGNADVDPCAMCRHSLVNRVYSFNQVTGRLTLVANTVEEDETFAVAWDQTGQYIAVGNARGCLNKRPCNRIYHFDKSTKKLCLVATTNECDNTYAVAWNPDPHFAGYFVFGNAKGYSNSPAPLRLYFLDTETYTLQLVYSTAQINNNTFALAWGICGRYLAVGQAKMVPSDDDADQIYFFDPQSPFPLSFVTTFNGCGDTTALAWHHDGFQIFATNAAGIFNCTREIKTFNVKGSLCPFPCFQQPLIIELESDLPLMSNPTSLSLKNDDLVVGLALRCGGACDCEENGAPPFNKVYDVTHAQPCILDCGQSYCPEEYHSPEEYGYEYGYEPYLPYPPKECPFIGRMTSPTLDEDAYQLSVSYEVITTGSVTPLCPMRSPLVCPPIAIPCPPSITVKLGIFPAHDCDNGMVFCEDKECGPKKSQLYIEPGTLCFEICSANVRHCKPLPRVWKSPRNAKTDIVACLCNLKCQVGDEAFKSALKLILKDLSPEDKHMVTHGCKLKTLECCEELPAPQPRAYSYCPSLECHKIEDAPEECQERQRRTMKQSCGKLSGCCNFDPACDTLTFMFDEVQHFPSGAIITFDFISSAYTITYGKIDEERHPIFFSAKFAVFPCMTLDEFFAMNR